MKRMFIAILAGLLAGTVAHADQSARLTRVYDWFLGEWTVTVSQDGETKTGTLSVKRGAGDRCHVGIGTVENVINQMLFGYDPSTKRWTGTSFASDGSSYRSVLDEFKRDRIQKGDTWSSSFTRVAADGTTTTGPAVWTIVDENTLTIQYTQRKQGNKKLPDITERYVRKESVPTATYEDFLEWGNRLEGRWAGQLTIGSAFPELGKKKGETVPAYLIFRWVADKRGLESMFVSGQAEFRGLSYYDPGTKQIKETIVGNSGTSWVTTVGRKGDEWPWTLSGHLDGKKYEAAGVSFNDGKGTHRVMFRGETSEDVYKKVSKEPSK